MFPAKQNPIKNNARPTQSNMYYSKAYWGFYYYSASYFAWKKIIYEILLPRKTVNSYPPMG